MRYYLFLSLCILCVQPLYAQSVLDSTIVLPEVEVIDQRNVAATLESGSRITYLDGATLSKSQHLADLIETQTPLFVRRYGAAGLATLSIRGTGASHSVVMIDGQRFADPQSGQIDLSTIPSLLIESVEIVSGVAAARGGAAGLGGVLNVKTLGVAENRLLKASLSTGAYDLLDVDMLASARRKRLSAVVAFERNGAENDYPYVNSALLPATQFRRVGADHLKNNLFLRTTYAHDNHTLSLAWWSFWNERGLPGLSNAPPVGARQWDTLSRIWLHGSRSYRKGAITIDGFLQQRFLRYVDERRAQDDTTRTVSFQVDVAMRHAVGGHLFVMPGIEFGGDRSLVQDGVRQERAAAYVSGIGVFGRWHVFPSLRLEQHWGHHHPVTLFNPKIGVNVQPFRWRDVRVKASIGRAARVPTFNERYWVPGGNPDLDSEYGWGMDAGVALELPAARRIARFEIAVFQTTLRDQITWFPSFVGTGIQVWSPLNINRVRTQGLEIDLSYESRVSRHMDARWVLGYTYIEAHDLSVPGTRSYGQQLRYTPREKLNFAASLSWKYLSISVDGQLVGRRYVTSDETMYLRPYQVFNGGVGYEIPFDGVRLRAGVKLNNVFNQDYEVMRFYPMPPRHLTMNLTLNFHS